MSAAELLPQSLRVIERGWLSANTVMAETESGFTLVDTGYHTHTGLLDAALGHLLKGQPVHRVLNTHLHSDHCGGNAWLAQRYPGIEISIPGSMAQRVAQWSQSERLYAAVGQTCPAFTYTHVHVPGDVLQMGNLDWQVLAAPGHDADSVMFFNDRHRILMSADALWENGFGVLFPLLDGEDAITDQHATLNLIESLDARIVIPGHGAVFSEVNRALDTARQRLHSFTEKPHRAIQNALRVLMKFNLLEAQRVDWVRYRETFADYPAIRNLVERYLPDTTDRRMLADQTAQALVAAGAAGWSEGHLCNR